MNQEDFRIGKIENDRFVIMQQYQTFAEFWIKRNGGLTVSYCLAYKDLNVTDKIVLNLRIQEFVDGVEVEG